MATTAKNLFVIDHPLLKHMLTEARDKTTPPEVFRRLLRMMGLLLGYEAMRDLSVVPASIETPLEVFEGRQVRLPVTIVPILRAGMGLADGVHDLLPEAQVGHIGMARDEKSLEPQHYYRKLPPNVGEGPVMLIDPMLATGGSLSAAMKMLAERGCRDVRVICLLATPEGVAKFSQDWPDTPIYTAALDRGLDGRGFIMPGLGDAGDRLYGT